MESRRLLARLSASALGANTLHAWGAETLLGAHMAIRSMDKTRERTTDEMRVADRQTVKKTLQAQPAAGVRKVALAMQEPAATATKLLAPRWLIL